MSSTKLVSLMWIVFALGAALSAATVVTLTKIGVKNVDSSLAFAIQSIMILLVSWSVVIGQGSLPDLANVDRKAWLFLIGAGILTCVSSLLSFHALKIGNAAQVSPLTNTSLVFAVILAGVFLKEKINGQIILGALLMGAGAVLIAIAKK